MKTILPGKKLARRLPRRLACALVVAAVLIQPAHAQLALPALGDGAEMSLAAERRLGDRIVRELYRDPDYIDDAVLGDYVRGIWQRLMSAARQRGELSPELEERFAWDILLGRDRSVNAFALPGGYMGVHLGLIAAVESEDELASVLGHELSHVSQRHIARIISRQSSQSPWLIGAMILGALAASRSADAGGALIVGGQAAAVQGQLNFSRDMEREADRVGYGVMTEAGFAPRGFVSMFEKLQQANRFNDSSNFPYLRSHPLTTERIADMQARQQLLPETAPRPKNMAHLMLAARARLLAYPGVDGQRAALAQADGASFSTLGAEQQAGVLYGAIMGAMGLREYAQAQVLHRRLQAHVQGHPQAEYQAAVLGTELAMAAGDLQGADRLLTSLGKTTEAGKSRAAVLLRARVSTQTQNAQAAAEQLRIWVSQKPHDAQAWQLLSEAYGAQGQALRAVRAEAEAYAARLDYAAALDRLKAAHVVLGRSKEVDHIEASIIDTRRRQLEALLREQALER